MIAIILFKDGHLLQLRSEIITICGWMNMVLHDYDVQMIPGDKSGLNFLTFPTGDRTQARWVRGNNIAQIITIVNKCVCVCVCFPMPTHCTIACFGFHARRINGIECGLFSIHAPLGQTTLRVGQVSV